ncbi:MAG: protein kinase [Anaerolineales bacterium]|nr:protein kinase [Anaerolineales bacterium]
MALTLGQLIHHDRYRIDDMLGKGGMGAVYKAWDLSLEIPVAIKENLETSPEARKQFLREANILAKLSHPNLPRVIDHFYIPDQGQYLVMDYIEGEDLKSMLDRLGRLPESMVVNWIGQITDALAYLHRQPQPIIHRDIKPSNIKIRPDGSAVLVDFGIAKVFDVHLVTTVGAKAVTPGYSPPEQYGGGNTDVRSDIYALGATLYHLLTGRTPPESVQRVVDSTVMPPPRQINEEISPDVEHAIMKSVELSTDRRYQNMDELKNDLTTPLRKPASKPAPEAGRPADDPNATITLQERPTSAVPPEQLIQVVSAPASPPHAPAAAQPAAKGKFPVLWVAIGGGALAVCLLAVLVISLVSRSLGGKSTPTAAIVAASSTPAISTTAAPTIASAANASSTPQPETPTPADTPTPPPVDIVPTSYTAIGSLIIPDNELLRGVAYQDGYAYVVSRKGVLYLFDLSGLAVGQDFTSYDQPVNQITLQSGNGLLRNGDFLYVYGNSGIQTLDIQDPANPVLKSTQKGLIIYGLYQTGDTLVATGDREIFIYDISDPVNPKSLSKYRGDAGATYFTSIAYEGLLYVTEFLNLENKTRGRMAFFEFSDPASMSTAMKMEGRIDTQEIAYHMFIEQGMMIRCTTNDVELWDLSRADAPAFKTSERAQARVCAYDRGNIITNGDIYAFANNRLTPLNTFDAAVECSDAQVCSLKEAFPYGSLVAPPYVFLTQAGRVLILAGE